MMLTVEVFLVVLSCILHSAKSFNVGTTGVKIFSGPADEQFGYAIQQLTNHQGKWLLLGAPWKGYPDNRRGDMYKCLISGSKSTCDKLNLQNSVSVPSVKNVNVNMSLGMTLTRIPKTNGLMTCGPLWAQQCGGQYFYPGVCADMSPLFSVQRTRAPAIQTCGGPMDLIIVLDGSNSIYPWEPMNQFLRKLIPALDIGPHSTQVSVVQYAVDPHFEFTLNQYKTKEQVLSAASAITQKYGHSTNTFQAIDFASDFGFQPQYGGRADAAKVLVVVTDGESHDSAFAGRVLAKCEANKVTRFGIAVLGSYIRNNRDPSKLIEEIKSIASSPIDNFFFNVSEEAALVKIAGTLGERIFNIEGAGKGGKGFQMEMAQVGFSAHYSSKHDELLLGAVGAYDWSGTVVHQTGQKTDIFPFSTFQDILQDNTHHSSLLGYSVTTLNDGTSQYYVAGAPRSNHSGQVIVYTLNSQRKLTVIDSERGQQIGAYFGSVLCSLDVDKDDVSDLLLVGAPMFMNTLKKEQGRVYLFSVTKGILNEHGYLNGPSSLDDARFGMAISPVSDLDLDGFSDVVVGAPLEDGGKGVVYIYNGKQRTLNKQHSQRILGSELDSKLRYFGRSLDTSGDMNDDTMPDISVGALGKVVQLWSRGVARVTATAVFIPDKINILGPKCDVNGRKLLCVDVRVSFSASFRPKSPVGPLDLAYNFTLDADLQSSHVASRGLFRQNKDRVFSGTVQLSDKPVVRHHSVYVQEGPDFVNPLGLRVDIGLRRPDANPVLDIYSTQAWAFSVPFSKGCGSDVCSTDLVLNVKKGKEVPSSSPMLVSFKNRRLSFEVVVKNVKENAYNTKIIATFSSNLFYASVTPPSDGTDVKCSSVQDSLSLVCQVAYPALEKNQQVKFLLHFDFNFNHLQSTAQVDFQAQSDGKDDRPADNKVGITIPVRYDSELILTKKSSINFYVVEEYKGIKTSIKDFADIGPEFNLSVKVTTVNIPVALAYLTASLPISTKGGNPLLYLTSISTQPTQAVMCESSGVVNPLRIGPKPQSVSFKRENLRKMTSLDCKTAKCASVKCVLKGMTEKRHYFVNITARIWNGTFASSTFQTLDLTATTEIETSQPDLLIIGLNKAMVSLTISKPGEKADVPVGVIVGSVIGGLLILALAVGLLWKFGFFKRKYKQLQKEAEGELQVEEGL